MNPEFTSYKTILGNPRRRACYPILIGARDANGRVPIQFGSPDRVSLDRMRPAPAGMAQMLKALAQKQFNSPAHAQAMFGQGRSNRGQGAGKKKTRRARQGITAPSTPAVVPMVNRISPEANKARKKLLAQKLKERRR